MPLLSSDELSTRVRSLPALAAVLAAADAGEPRIYLVGGAVRDLLRGGEPTDIDLCVEGPAEPLLTRLPGEVTVHRQFGTATVTHGGLRYDVAQARTETYPRPGALPEVRGADIRSDLQRRDFTVNAIALDLRSGELLSARGALADLDAGRLEVLHDASFIDDPTRLFRLARYRARLGFTVGERTARLAHEAILSGAARTVSGTRIGNELRLLATEPDPVAAFIALAELDPGERLVPGFGLVGDIAVPLPPERQIADSMRMPVSATLAPAVVAARALRLLPRECRRDRVILAVCAIGIAAGHLTALLDDCGFSAPDRDAIVAVATRAELLAGALLWARRPSAIAETVANRTLEEVAVAGALGPEAQAEQWLTDLRQRRLGITGEDLTAAGVSAGPAVGAGLQAARMAMLDGGAASPERQLEIALAAAGTFSAGPDDTL